MLAQRESCGGIPLAELARRCKEVNNGEDSRVNGNRDEVRQLAVYVGLPRPTCNKRSMMTQVMEQCEKVINKAAEERGEDDSDAMRENDDECDNDDDEGVGGAPAPAPARKRPPSRGDAPLGKGKGSAKKARGDAEDDDDDDDEPGELDSLSFKLRNAVGVGAGGGKVRALTRANARFAASFAAPLLRERGYVCRTARRRKQHTRVARI